MENMMKENTVPTYVKPYKEMMIDSDQLEVPRNTYQRRQEPDQITKISLNFDERIANEPKVSYRDGRYFVFDGQHTIAARVHRNGGKPLPILCKVYFGMTEKEEALLFAQQTGFSRDLGAGPELRAKAFGEDQVVLKFIAVTEETGAVLDMSQKRGRNRLACVATAFKEFSRLGPEKYKEALSILLEAWDGDPDALRSETVTAMCAFVDLYWEEYDRKRLIRQCRKKDPLTIYRDGRAMGDALGGYKKYLAQVVRIYNGASIKTALPIKY